MGSRLGPDPSPELGPVSQQPPTRTNCTGPLDLESFCFLFPHISGVGVFSKTQTHLLTKREKKLGEQGACGQRSDPSSPRAMPGSPSSLLPAPNGCHRLLLAISRLFVFNIYLHLPFPSHPPPTLLLQQLPHQCTSPGGTQQSRPSQAQAPSLGWGHQAGPSSWWAEPRAPEAAQAPPRPAPLWAAPPTLPPFSHRLWKPKGRKGREKPDTHKGEVGKEGGDGETQQAWGGV